MRAPGVATCPALTQCLMMPICKWSKLYLGLCACCMNHLMGTNCIYWFKSVKIMHFNSLAILFQEQILFTCSWCDGMFQHVQFVQPSSHYLPKVVIVSLNIQHAHSNFINASKMLKLLLLQIFVLKIWYPVSTCIKLLSSKNLLKNFWTFMSFCCFTSKYLLQTSDPWILHTECL